MVHTFFFVMSFLTDYRAIAEIVRGEATLALASVGLAGLGGGLAAIRGLLSRARKSAMRQAE